MTFDELNLEKHKKTKDYDTDLLSLFAQCYDDDEIETLDFHDVRERLDYSGGLHQLIDRKIEIYKYELRKRAVENYEYVEDAISEGLSDGTDFHQSIQSGQYLLYSQQLDKDIGQLVDDINEIVEAEIEKQGVLVKLPQDFKGVSFFHTPKTWKEAEDWVEALPIGETRGMAYVALYMAWNFWVSKLKEWEIEHE
jgi:urease gamma subunit